jgi:hypothetical protein
MSFEEFPSMPWCNAYANIHLSERVLSCWKNEILPRMISCLRMKIAALVGFLVSTVSEKASAIIKSLGWRSSTLVVAINRSTKFQSRIITALDSLRAEILSCSPQLSFCGVTRYE